MSIQVLSSSLRCSISRSSPQNQTTRKAIFPKFSFKKQKLVVTNMSTQVRSSNADNSCRPSAEFHSTIWGDHFLSHVSNTNNDEASMLEQHEVLKEEMRSIIMDVMSDPSKNLHLIDAIQRLAVDYHFKDEIEVALKKLFQNFDDDENDLNAIALRFRLLRQQGIRTSCNVFEKFKDNEGNFKQSLIHDIDGTLSLYEAAHLGIRGEDILDKALAFTSTNLQSILLSDNVEPHLRAQVNHALNRPIRKCVHRLEGRRYINAYSEEESHNTTLLKFAKLDFNIVQRIHQKELIEITKWWKSLDVATRFPYARDRIVECYFLAMAMYFEPHYYLARKMLAKIMAIGTIIDDTYDNYATYEEAQLLTKAIQRWDIEEMNTLPDYMKMLYFILIDTYNGFEEVLAKEGRSFCVHYAKEETKRVAQAYDDEIKWRCEGYVPSMEEYRQVSLRSCSCQLLELVSFLGMGNIATKEVFEWISTTPKAVHASQIIGRFLDDIMSHEFEQKREHVASGVECYVKQYGVGKEEAVRSFREEIANAWKDINEACLKPNPVPMPILERVLNMARLADVLYEVEDGFTNAHILKHHVSSLLNDPVDLALQ